MAHNSAALYCEQTTMLQQLLADIVFQRSKEIRQLVMDGCEFVNHGSAFWTDLFVRHFLFQTEHMIDADDLLFFIRKKRIKCNSKYLPTFETEMDVFRKDSKRLPVGDPDIVWEETVYLNLIIHEFDYTLTLAICTRTSPKELQVLHRHSQKVYASPSKRRMDTKGDLEEITYPYVCFMVDNFNEVFCDVLVRDGEMVCVELVASDRCGKMRNVIFIGSIRYEALKTVYNSRMSLTNKTAQQMIYGLFSGSSIKRTEFIRLKGPYGKGHAELAVAKPKGSGCDVETPTSEPGYNTFDAWDSDLNSDLEEFYFCRHQRRLSDPCTNLNVFANGNMKLKMNENRTRSESDGLDSLAHGLPEIEAGDVRDELDDGVYNPLWTMKGFAQTFHFWKETRRAQSIPLNMFLTYITLPWWSIMEDILSDQESPILTF
ncbi:uncharacterized protein KIAA0930 homolog [Adelges cooleyi]|uniref:uncharacterized protein KIAA0930 homolog n=1 Tax=Adelges cooleyi TaxID=133065 RepID=UPI00217F35E5|nr:uncharacterized protein KIAA0930 homolog [Adelges cooleyi]